MSTARLITAVIIEGAPSARRRRPGVRVAVHDSRQNDRDPVIWQPGQDYRTPDAIHAVRSTRDRKEHSLPERYLVGRQA